MSPNLKEFTKWNLHYRDVFPAISCSRLCQGNLQSFLHTKCPAPKGAEKPEKQAAKSGVAKKGNDSKVKQIKSTADCKLKSNQIFMLV